MTLARAVEILKGAGVDSPLYDARQIFHRIGGIPMERLVLGGEVEDGSPAHTAILKRAARVPLEYVIGYTDFYRESYIVSDKCLIPRDDTEVLVDFTVKNIPPYAGFVDLCTQILVLLMGKQSLCATEHHGNAAVGEGVVGFRFTSARLHI